MVPYEKIKAFYQAHLPEFTLSGHTFSGGCPLCDDEEEKRGQMAVQLKPQSVFAGYFRCSKNCTPSGFHHYFARVMGIDGRKVPGFNPDAQVLGTAVDYPSQTLDNEIERYITLMDKDQLEIFDRCGVSKATLKAMRVGFNGRYIIYPYYQENGHVYCARFVLPDQEEESFWHGDDAAADPAFHIFNLQAVDRCQGGALFITDGEINQLILTELGYPAIAVPTVSDLTAVSPDRLVAVDTVFLLLSHTPEARLAARDLAVGLGFKARILEWSPESPRGTHLAELAGQDGVDLKTHVAGMLQRSKAFSPFASVQLEQRRMREFLESTKGKALMGLKTGFPKLDKAVEGLSGINIMGGPPKAGKSCFFMQISTQIAQNGTPVIYYDFENGRHKIYLRTLVRISRLTEKKIRQGPLDPDESRTLKTAWAQFSSLLAHFRVVTERKLTPEVMRRHIDFIKHETRRNDLLLVIDSLHKLPFKKLSERRTGIDSWLRHFEAVRDEEQACFLVISELSRGKGGGYGERPDLSSFKESGDIEYSADNAMILSPNWDPLETIGEMGRKSILWLVASRENNPGQVAEYQLDYPFWCFKES
jgi:replicative DNA helicase